MKPKDLGLVVKNGKQEFFFVDDSVYSCCDMFLKWYPKEVTGLSASQSSSNKKIPAKKWGDTEIAERGRSVLVMRARYRSAGLTPHQRGWTDAG